MTDVYRTPAMEQAVAQVRFIVDRISEGRHDDLSLWAHLLDTVAGVLDAQGYFVHSQGDTFKEYKKPGELL